jgi:hypothetical protein
MGACGQVWTWCTLNLPFSKSLFLRIESVDILAHIPTIPPVIFSLSRLLLYIAFMRSYIRVKSAWTFFSPRRVVRSAPTIRQPVKEEGHTRSIPGSCRCLQSISTMICHPSSWSMSTAKVEMGLSVKDTNGGRAGFFGFGFCRFAPGPGIFAIAEKAKSGVRLREE